MYAWRAASYKQMRPETGCACHHRLTRRDLTMSNNVHKAIANIANREYFMK